ncbi:uncharacterized protein Z519_09675 [Cladophialophora bantiana CBS 173.52]|uniref:Uncharacterized protein n=1 Tax=Cladophialophora bantiana (strain ATCC 10958 / CBS 173.52 / CDC B-1940 / NIH 8579) TaxID=1442370 RepID=A0A0D2HYB2_CLAB1|nr:uncharacterized protein Z519_09675 [Cladophialophora bantiana CBS 173.52]KIW89519.1 hypothetical protein Z519_09675 [Cladophialophora bantiana CBS 173.52]
MADLRKFVRFVLKRNSKPQHREVRLEAPPDNTQCFHKTVFAEYNAERSKFEIQQLRNLFRWPAYAKSNFTLVGGKLLLELTSTWSKVESAAKEAGSTPAKELDWNSKLDRKLSRAMDVEIELVEAEDESSFLTFSAPSLRAYYRDSPGKERVNAHVLMFKMISSILTIEGENPQHQCEERTNFVGVTVPVRLFG